MPVVMSVSSTEGPGTSVAPAMLAQCVGLSQQSTSMIIIVDPRSSCNDEVPSFQANGFLCVEDTIIL
jgi:hypothetical protein